MIDPLYGGKSAHDVLQTLLDRSAALGLRRRAGELRSTLRARATSQTQLAQGAARWLGRRTRHSRRRRQPGGATALHAPPPASAEDAIEIIFRPDPSIYDGRYSNVGWLQELPKPVTNLSWDNAAMMSWRHAWRSSGLEESDVIEITLSGQQGEGAGARGCPAIRQRGHGVSRLWPRSRRAAWARAWASTPT